MSSQVFLADLWRLGCHHDRRHGTWDDSQHDMGRPSHTCRTNTYDRHNRRTSDPTEALSSIELDIKHRARLLKYVEMPAKSQKIFSLVGACVETAWSLLFSYNLPRWHRWHGSMQWRHFSCWRSGSKVVISSLGDHAEVCISFSAVKLRSFLRRLHSTLKAFFFANV